MLFKMQMGLRGSTPCPGRSSRRSLKPHSDQVEPVFIRDGDLYSVTMTTPLGKITKNQYLLLRFLCPERRHCRSTESNLISTCLRFVSGNQFTKEAKQQTVQAMLRSRTNHWNKMLEHLQKLYIVKFLAGKYLVEKMA